MAGARTVSVTSVVYNNSGVATSVTRTVGAVVVGDNIVADFRELNPGVQNNAFSEVPTSRQTAYGVLGA